MSAHTIPPEQQAQLRTRATSRLTGVGSAEGGSFRASDALAVLHGLASSPDTAADALAVLHELQVHQVELEVQAEELRESRSELESALRRRTELYDHQPVACFSIDRGLVVHELNLAGADLLGSARDEAYGLALDSVLSPAGGRTLRELVAGAAPGRAARTAMLRMAAKDGVEETVRAHVGSDPAGQGFLVVLTKADAPR